MFLGENHYALFLFSSSPTVSIIALGKEQSELYRLAAKPKFSTKQRARLQEINGSLPNLWDRYRREFASERYGRKSNSHDRRFAA